MSTNELSLTSIDPDKLIHCTNELDLRRDLHAYVNYVRGRKIKRSFRGNELPPSDYKRLAQLMKIKEADDEHDYETRAGWHMAEARSWVDYVDGLAHKMGFVSYDTKGSYRGYSSTEPSFQDNFIGFNSEVYQQFLTLSIADQERQLFDTLVNAFEYSRNEFYQRSILGRLDHFDMWGSGTGVMPLLNFANIRRFLFALLQRCQPETWYSTASLIAYLKANHRFFLIPDITSKLVPDKTDKTKKHERYPQIPPNRYGNFHEDTPYSRESVPDDAPDGFERVEGRYIERFLEGIPLTLGYVDVAYDSVRSTSQKLSYGRLKAFRVNGLFLQAMRGDMPRPKVTIQPNFEIYIESAFYPAYLLDRLTALTELIREDKTTILKLQKQKVAAQLVEDDKLDVIHLLKDLSGKDLPQNVQIELQEWTSHADVFTLFDGFGLVEFVGKLPNIDSFTVEKIGESMQLVRNPSAVFAQLHEGGAVAIRAFHTDQKLQPLPEMAQTVFPRKVTRAPAKKKKAKSAVIIKRETLAALHFPSDDLFEKFRKVLIDLHCLFEADKENRTLTIGGQHESQIKQAIKLLADDYAIRLEDVV